MSCCVGVIFSHGRLLTHNKPHFTEREIKSSEDGVRLPTWRGSLKTVAHATLSPCGLYLHLYMYRCGCTYWVTLRMIQGSIKLYSQKFQS